MSCKHILYVTIHAHVLDKMRLIFTKETVLIRNDSIWNSIVIDTSKAPVDEMESNAGTCMCERMTLRTATIHHHSIQSMRLDTYHRLQLRMKPL